MTLRKSTRKEIRRFARQKHGCLKNHGKKWQKEEILYLKTNYGKVPTRKIALYLKRSHKATSAIAVKMNFTGSSCGKLNAMWRGNKVGYKPLHQWVKRHKPKPKFCEECKKREPYDLANISGKYKRDISDYKWTCRRCHMIKDERMKNLKQYQEEKQ